MKRIFIIALVAVIAFSMAACGDGNDSGGSDTPTVSSVTISPAATIAAKGSNTKTFSATVTGANSPAQTVTWSIVESNKHAQTTISSSGVLTVAAAESLGALTVKATSTVNTLKSGTAAVVLTAANNPNDPDNPQQFDDISAAELVANIQIGWNLGNTLDAHSTESWFPTDVAGMETSWSNPVTTKAMITALKNAGFNGIRLPITWYKVADANYNIRADWMARIVEVVNYAVDNDMYILLNTHHDEGIFKFTNAQKTNSLKAFKKIWEQIADTFKNYDEKLIFEGLNEPRTIGAAYEWNGGNAEERANLNEYYQVFVNTVRASGGNNGKRILMVNTYAASAELSALNGLTIPTDSTNTKNKIVVSIHAYAPFGFAHQYNTSDAVDTWSKNNPADIAGVNYAIDNAYNKFVSKGYPVIIGEFGARSEKAAAYRAEWAEYYVRYARSRSIPCFLWDDGDWFKFLNRSNNTFYDPSVLAALMNGLTGELPPITEPGGEVAGGNITMGAWTWNAFNDGANGGTSSITIEETSGAMSVSGNVTTDYEYGFAGWEAVPNTAEMANLKTAASISFKVKGDGKTYKLMLPTSDITDYSYYYTTFTATATETTITVNLPGGVASPGWGQSSSGTAFNQSNVAKVQWQTNDGANGAFNLTIRDLQLNQ